jgi:hypothetical protein
MRVAGGYEQKGTRFHGLPPRSIKEQCLSAGDKVDLVSRMRLLSVETDWRVNLDHE